jgi:hypothetical protein
LSPIGFTAMTKATSVNDAAIRADSLSTLERHPSAPLQPRHRLENSHKG